MIQKEFNARLPTLYWVSFVIYHLRQGVGDLADPPIRPGDVTLITPPLAIISSSFRLYWRRMILSPLPQENHVIPPQNLSPPAINSPSLRNTHKVCYKSLFFFKEKSYNSYILLKTRRTRAKRNLKVLHKRNV